MKLAQVSQADIVIVEALQVISMAIQNQEMVIQKRMECLEIEVAQIKRAHRVQDQ